MVVASIVRLDICKNRKTLAFVPLLQHAHTHTQRVWRTEMATSVFVGTDEMLSIQLLLQSNSTLKCSLSNTDQVSGNWATVAHSRQ